MIDIPYLILVLVVILFSMTLHEVMHGFMAYWLGDDTAKAQGRLSFNPIHHIDPIMTIALPLFLAVLQMPIFGGAKPVPFNPSRVKWGEWGAALVGLIGPLTNFFIAFVAFGILAVLNLSLDTAAGQVLMTIVGVNLGFFVFNMLPIPPLDGSRVLYALAPDVVRRGMEWVETYGIFLVFAIVLVASSAIGRIMGAGIEGIIRLFALIFGVH